MLPSVKVYGGFPNTGTPGFGDRDPDTYITILTGEIGSTGTNTDNSFHVVTADNSAITDENCRLDGFTITKGYAVEPEGKPPIDAGRGGGGILITGDSDIRIHDCIITDNRSGAGELGYGAGIKIDDSDPVISRCVISNNGNIPNALMYGGGIVVGNGSGTDEDPVNILDCTIEGNTAAHGAGVAIKSTAFARLVNCLIIDNAIDPTGVTNQTPYGGGVGIDRAGQGWMINCTFSGNTAGAGGAVAVWANGSLVSELRGSILWENAATTGSEIYVAAGTAGLIVDRCNIEDLGSTAGVAGTITSTNNLDTDPLFIGSGNYHLQCGSPCVNTADDAAIPQDDFDVDEDSDEDELTPDRDLADRVVGNVADRGAYELAQSESCPADIAPTPTPNGIVDTDDLLALLGLWGTCASPPPAACPGDITGPCAGSGDGSVDTDDLLLMLGTWGACPGGESMMSGGGPSLAECLSAGEENGLEGIELIEFLLECLAAQGGGNDQ